MGSGAPTKSQSLVSFWQETVKYMRGARIPCRPRFTYMKGCVLRQRRGDGGGSTLTAVGNLAVGTSDGVGIESGSFGASASVAPWGCMSLILILMATLQMMGAESAGAGAKPVATSTNTPLHSVLVKRPAGTPKVATGLTNFERIHRRRRRPRRTGRIRSHPVRARAPQHSIVAGP